MRTLANIQASLLQKFNSKFSESNREQKLFLDWMAYEIYSIYRELSKSRDAIEQNLHHRLVPETSKRPIPVHTLAHAATDKPRQLLKPGDAVYTIQKLPQQEPNEIYFTPLKPTQIFGLTVRWKCYKNCIHEVLDGQISGKTAYSHTEQAFHPGVMWMGIERSKNAVVPEHLVFHVDSGTNNEENKTEQLMPLIQWYNEEKSLNSTVGMDKLFTNPTSTKCRPLDSEYLHLRAIEKNVIQTYNNQFITVSLQGGGSSQIPEVIKNSFDQDIVETIQKQDCIWVKLIFPSGFTPSMINQLQIRLNCFPIINRKLDRSKDFQPSHFGSIEIQPLSNSDHRRGDLAHSGDFFLAMEQVFSSKIDYRATTFESFREAPPGFYALQHSRVEANDFRDVLHRSEELALLLGAKIPRIQQIANHNLQSALHDLQSGCTTLGTALQQVPPQHIDQGYYLHVKAHDPQDMIYVRFWLTQGTAAEGVLTKGDLLEGGKGEGVWII